MIIVQNFELKNKKETFSERLKYLILSGQLRPGDRLEPERELALRYGISRGSVNQAILDLERIGFLRIVPRKGTYVSEYLQNATPETLAAIMSFDSDMVESSLFRDLMALRILVEKECARLAGSRVNSRVIAELSERTEDIFRAGDDVADVVYEFHRYIVQLSGNSAYTVVFRSFETMLRSMIELHYSDKKEVQRSLPYYERIAAAISRGDGEEAEKIMSELLSEASSYLDRLLRGRETENAKNSKL